jgi:hypothetical protein
MNNNLLVAVIFSAFLLGGGSVYIYMSPIAALTAGKANVVDSERLRLLTNQMTSLTAKVDQLNNNQLQMMKQKKFQLGSVPFQEATVIEEKSATKISACKEAAGTIALVNLATGMGMTSGLAECE